MYSYVAQSATKKDIKLRRAAAHQGLNLHYPFRFQSIFVAALPQCGEVARGHRHLSAALYTLRRSRSLQPL